MGVEAAALGEHHPAARVRHAATGRWRRWHESRAAASVTTQLESGEESTPAKNKTRGDFFSWVFFFLCKGLATRQRLYMRQIIIGRLRALGKLLSGTCANDTSSRPSSYSAYHLLHTSTYVVAAQHRRLGFGLSGLLDLSYSDETMGIEGAGLGLRR